MGSGGYVSVFVIMFSMMCVKVCLIVRDSVWCVIVFV